MIGAIGAPPQVLEGGTYNFYASVVQRFIQWAVQQYWSAVGSHADYAKDFELARGKVSAAFQSQQATPAPQRSLYGLPDEQYQHLTALISPKHPRNPFKRPTRLRNQIMVSVFFETGLRRGELAKLYINDLKVEGFSQELMVIRRPDDPEDHRRICPAAKTLGRDLPISRELARTVQRYINTERGNSPSPFLFVSSRKHRRALVVRQINNVFSSLHRVCPEIEHLEPRTGRRTFNDRYLDDAMRKGLDPTDPAAAKRIQDGQNYVNGWTINSKQGPVYARRIIEEKARSHVRALQANLAGIRASNDAPGSAPTAPALTRPA